jgi:uncharacterized membrane protein YebE (DUF533 family)
VSRERGNLWLFKELWGFDAVPSVADFDVFMKAVLTCANGDGQLTARERDWVVGYCAALGGPDTLLEELRAYPADEDTSQLVERRPPVVQSRRALVYDAIRACAADGDIREGERAVIRRLAAQIGVPEDVVQALEKIYQDERTIRQKRLDLVFPEGRPY